MAINKTLQSQIQQSLGIGNQAQFDEFLAAVAALAQRPDVTPVVQQGMRGLQSLLEQVDGTYTDFQGRVEDLDLSSGNLEFTPQMAGESAPQLPMQFVRVLESIDGDLALFVVIAEKAVSEFQRTADRLDALVGASDVQGLASEAHKLCSVWAMYAKTGEEGMAAQLETSAKGGQRQMALALAGQMVIALRDAAQSLHIWHGQMQGKKHQ